MRYILITFLALVPYFAANAQSQPRWSEVRNSDEYIYGKGSGKTMAEADEQALKALLVKFHDSVAGRYECPASIADKSGYVKILTDSYMSAAKANTGIFTLNAAPEAERVRYIHKDSLDNIFDSRRNKIREMVRDAARQEEKMSIDNALRFYWWAYLLTNSLPKPMEEAYTDAKGQKHLLCSWIPQQMNAILEKVEVMTSRNPAGSELANANPESENIRYLAFSYKGERISSIDYTYHDGEIWSQTVSAKDGMGLVELKNPASMTGIDVRVEYRYADNAHIEDDIMFLMGVIPEISLGKASFTCSMKPQAPKAKPSDDRSTLSVVTNMDKYNNILVNVLFAIQQKNYDSVSRHFTAEGLEIYRRLLKYGNAQVIDANVSFHNIRDQITARGVKMSFAFRNGIRKMFVEDVVFMFTKEGLIDNISFGLGEQAERDILYKETWPEDVRVLIMEFLENYKTAFALERLEYLRDIFDEDAVIIVGRKVEKRVMKTSDNALGNMTMTQIDMIRRTKDEYMESLAKCFDSNEFINIRFTNTDVVKSVTAKEVYGIQIRQDYYSTNYGDTGYLNLVIDFNDPEKPLIKIRTWQPEPDPEFGILTPFDF